MNPSIKRALARAALIVAATASVGSVITTSAQADGPWVYNSGSTASAHYRDYGDVEVACDRSADGYSALTAGHTYYEKANYYTWGSGGSGSCSETAWQGSMPENDYFDYVSCRGYKSTGYYERCGGHSGQISTG